MDLCRPLAHLRALARRGALLIAASSFASIATAQLPTALSFAPGTTDEELAALAQSLPTAPPSYITGTRWPGATGAPAVVTWSFVPDGVTVSGAAPDLPSDLFAQLDTQFAAQGGRATWIARFQSVFDRWSEVSGVQFVRVTAPGVDWDGGGGVPVTGADATHGQIRIAGRDVSTGVNGYAFAPQTGDLVLNTSVDFASGANQQLVMRNVIGYLSGITVGLTPLCAPALMFPVASTTLDGPQHDDVRGIQRLYGDAFEEDDSAATAVPLGTLVPGAPLVDIDMLTPPPTGPTPMSTSLRSIDSFFDLDWLSFAMSAPGLVSIQCTPLGFEYQDDALVGNACPSNPASTNSLVVANLKIELLAADAVTVLASAGSQPAGAVESLTGFVTGSIAYVRVTTQGSSFGSQLYTLSLAVVDDCVGGTDCNGSGYDDVCDIVAGSSADVDENGVPDECDSFAGTLFCAGDHAGPTFTPCPCNNAGALHHGCANSANAQGAFSWATGATSPTDTVSLNTHDMPLSAVCIFLKGDVSAAATPIVFGDGLRCVDGTLIRLGTRQAVNGAASYPSGGGTPVSVRGSTPVGSGLTGYYQTYYRNAAAAFCPPATFNVSNGTILVW